MNFQILNPQPGIYWAKFYDQADLARSFCRMQEFYESPEFRAKVFTRDLLLEWFHSTYKKDYLQEWPGFNVPGWVVEVFRHGLFDPLDEEEVQLLTQIRNTPPAFYLIGSLHDDQETLCHEVSHALYALDPKYRKSVDEMLGDADFPEIKYALKEQGYDEITMRDEIHAYLMWDQEWLKEQGVPWEKYEKLANRLHVTFGLAAPWVNKF